MASTEIISTTNHPIKSSEVNPKKPTFYEAFKKVRIIRYSARQLNTLLNGLASDRAIIDNYLGSYRFFVSEGIKYHPDIIHANDLDTLLAGYLIRRKTGAKLIYDAHEIWTRQGLTLPKFIIIFHSLVERFLIKKVDAFISVNYSIIEEISRMYHYKFNFLTDAIYNCPNYQSFLIKRAFTQKRKIEVLYQGRYSPDRGLEELIEAGQFISDRAQITIRAVGDLEIEKKLKKIMMQFRLDTKVRFLKPVIMQDMVKKATASDIGIIAYKPTNINNKLSTPNKIFEYMMAGLALIVSDLPELKRIVKKYQNGLIFNPYDPKSIAKVINRLVKNPRLLRKMKQRSLLAAKTMNWENEAKKLHKIYYKLYANRINKK